MCNYFHLDTQEKLQICWRKRTKWQIVNKAFLARAPALRTHKNFVKKYWTGMQKYHMLHDGTRQTNLSCKNKSYYTLKLYGSDLQSSVSFPLNIFLVTVTHGQNILHFVFRK